MRLQNILSKKKKEILINLAEIEKLIPLTTKKINKFYFYSKLISKITKKKYQLTTKTKKKQQQSIVIRQSD